MRMTQNISCHVEILIYGGQLIYIKILGDTQIVYLDFSKYYYFLF
jgi:hypothetical protein